MGRSQTTRQTAPGGYVAPAPRITGRPLRRDIAFASKNAIVSGLLKTTGGLLAVLNEQRQILAVNQAFLETLGVRDAEAILGLRPGEAIQCVHADEGQDGCGTSRYCPSCGAAIAIVATLVSELPEERKCIATVERGGVKQDVCFQVRACQVAFRGRRLILLFLQDITAQERWAAAERVFFHDMANTLLGLHGAAGLMRGESEAGIRELAGIVAETAERLANEVEIQRTLLRDDFSDYRATLHTVTARQVVEQLRRLFANHPAAEGRTLMALKPPPRARVTTDLTLLTRVLTNMLVNAFEATDEGGEVRLWSERQAETIDFCVWNRRAIPDDIAQRIFQRHFSTKRGAGRGLGTYAMKLLGEHFLGGQVSFVSTPADGTTFRVALPA